MGRKLTEDEKRKVQQYARKHADPSLGVVVRVDVDDELDSDDRANFITLYKSAVVLSEM